MKTALAAILLVCCPLAVTHARPRTVRADDPRPGGGARTAVAASSYIVEAVPVPDATALKLDGELTEVVWSRAQKIDGFQQREPNEGAAVSFPTEARVAYDAQHLYVAILAKDPE